MEKISRDPAGLLPLQHEVFVKRLSDQLIDLALSNVYYGLVRLDPADHLPTDTVLLKGFHERRETQVLKDDRHLPNQYFIKFDRR